MRSLTFDAAKTIRGKFKPSAAAERDFYRQLKKVAIVSGHIVDQHTRHERQRLGFGVMPLHLVDASGMEEALAEYAKKLTPWAQRQSAKLLEQVQKSNRRAYANKSKAIGVALKLQVGETAVGRASIALMNEQVALIQSIPLEAGFRAQEIAREAVLSGTRADATAEKIEELSRELGLSTEVATSRALLIARTETARATATINQARAMAVGSGQYRWHNSGDGAVRDSHLYYRGKRLQGMIFSWDAPPTLDDGMTGHPGTFPNCRCFGEPVFDDE